LRNFIALEALRFQTQAPDWELRDDAHRIERTFRFRNFREALAFVQQVGELAETEGHHPDISFGWGRPTVSLSTKKIKGLHENVMASKIDRMLDRPVQTQTGTLP
jgi:4a-hydroxytetrahydrobiopterin dehydratase